MRFRKMVATIELLSVTSVISVGFSSWTAFTLNPASVQGNIQTENVININEYLTIKDFIFSDYDSGGFFDDFKYGVYSSDSTISVENTVAYLEAYIEVDLDMYCDAIGIDHTSAQNYSFDINLYCDTVFKVQNNTISTNFFNYSLNDTLSYSYSLYTASTGATTTSSSIPYTFEQVGGTDAGSGTDTSTINLNSALSTNIEISTPADYLYIDLVYGFTIEKSVMAVLLNQMQKITKGVEFKLEASMKI